MPTKLDLQLKKNRLQEKMFQIVTQRRLHRDPIGELWKIALEWGTIIENIKDMESRRIADLPGQTIIPGCE
jgi:hypothetical protein